MSLIETKVAQSFFSFFLDFHSNLLLLCKNQQLTQDFLLGLFRERKMNWFGRRREREEKGKYYEEMKEG